MEINSEEINELYDLRNFAKLRRQVLIDLTRATDERNIFLQKHSRDKIIKALLHPDRPHSAKMLREISHFFYAVSPHYRRAITMLATVMLNNYTIRPVGDTGKSEKAFYKDYKLLAQKCKRYRFKTEIPKMLTICLLDGIFCGIEYEDANNYMIKPVMPDFCVISSVENGVFKFAFDLNYFTTKTLLYLPEYGIDFVNAYRAYRGLKDADGKWITAPDKTKRWFEPKNQICLKFDPEMLWTIPPFVGIFKAIIDLDTYEELKKDGAMLDNYKLLHYKIPTDTDGVPKLTFEQASKYYNMSASVIPEGIGLVMSPFTLDAVNLKDNSDNTKNYTKEAANDLFANMGISPILFGMGDKVTSQTLEIAVKTIESMMLKPIRQIEHIYNVKIERMKLNDTFKNLMEIVFLEQSIFNKTKVQDSYLKGGMYGLPNKLFYAASMDLEPIDIINLSYLENTVLKCGEDIFNRPLISSTTLSGGDVESGEGGRPQTENPSDNTESNEDTSNEYK